MLRFFERFVWVLTIVLLLANTALALVWTRTGPSWPDDIRLVNEIIIPLGKTPIVSSSKKLPETAKPPQILPLSKRGARNKAGPETIVKTGKSIHYVVAEQVVEKLKNLPDAIYLLTRDCRGTFTRDARGELIILATYIRPNSLIDRLGFKAGDKIRSVNGYQISDEKKVIPVFEKLKNKRSFTVEIERGGRVMYFYYQITR